jgi:hypothetical protein
MRQVLAVARWTEGQEARISIVEYDAESKTIYETFFIFEGGVLEVIELDFPKEELSYFLDWFRKNAEKYGWELSFNHLPNF